MSPRPESLGYSVYLTSFERQREELEAGSGSGAAVFLSLHVSEEFSQDYCRRAEEACRWLRDRDYRIFADVSTKTVAQFGQPDLFRLAERLGIWAIRVDYGFTPTCRRTTGSTWWGRWKRPGSFWRTASAEEGNLS